MKKTLSTLFFFVLTAQAWAATTFTVDNLKYTVIEGTTNVSVGKASTPPSGELSIPEKVTNPDNSVEYSVTSIGSQAFKGCSGLTSITIPNSVKSIGSGAFQYCSGLTTVTIPNSVKSIGSSALSGCSGLTSITIPNSVTSIGSSAFRDCSGLTSITIPNSVTSIGEAAFCDCSSLTSVTIPNSVTSIGGGAFYGCSGLTSVTIPNSVTSIGNYAFYYCSALTSVTIPNSVKSIGNYAFYYCSALTSVTIGNSVTSIGEGAFRDCSGLTSVTIGNSVTSIGEGAFVDCSSLTSVTIPNSVTSIGSSAFEGCRGLTSVTIPNSVTSIGDYAFNHCSNATLYCEVEESQKHAGWDSKWTNGSSDYIKWGCKVIRAEANNEEYGEITGNYAVKGYDSSLWYLKETVETVTATLTATAKAGYHFVQWEDDTEAGATRVVSTAQSQPYKAIFAKDEPTAVSTTEQNSLAVSAYGRNITVTNATGEILVYDTTGRLVVRQLPQQQNVIAAANRGLYIVKSGNAAVRIIVK